MSTVSTASVNDAPPLAPHHLAMLVEGSGISADVIAERGYFTAHTAAELAKLGYSKTQQTLVPALSIPFWHLDGHVAFHQIRPDTPRHDAKKEKPAKYETPFQTRMVLDLHPAMRAKGQDPLVPLFITEGLRKADAITTHGGCAIGLVGIWNWRGTLPDGKKGVLPDWDLLPLAGRMVYLCFDSDAATNAKVQQAEQALSTMLTGRQAVVLILRIPPGADGAKQGADDFLLAHSLTELLACAMPAAQAKIPSGHASRQGQEAGLDLLTKRDGEPKAILTNVVEVLSQDARWQGVFGYDELAESTAVIRRPPYLPASATPWALRPVKDADDAETTNWLQRFYEVDASTNLVAGAIQMVAARHPFHPVQQYLHSLQWDEKPRLDQWLSTYAHADDSPYIRAVAASTLLSAVARVMCPGCKADAVPILEGEQGIYKSTLWRVLASDEWFSDSVGDLHTKDAAQSLRGKWIIELAELAAVHRSEVVAVNRFVAAVDDHYRPSYGRRAKTFLRQNIFVASTNQDAYLRDETGGRRWWPIKVTGPCDIAALERDRDQLWSEAYQRYQAGDKWYLSADLEKLASAEQAQRFEEDPWTSSILTYVLGRDETTTKELLTGGLALDAAQWTPANGKRLGSILRAHGWRLQSLRDPISNIVIKGWKRIPPVPPIPPIPPVTSVTPEPPSNEARGYSVTANTINGVTSVTSVTSESGGFTGGTHTADVCTEDVCTDTLDTRDLEVLEVTEVTTLATPVMARESLVTSATGNGVVTSASNGSVPLASPVRYPPRCPKCGTTAAPRAMGTSRLCTNRVCQYRWNAADVALKEVSP